MRSAGVTRSLQLWLTLLTGALSPLPFGSTDIFWVSAWVALLSIAGIIGCTFEFGPGPSRVMLVFLAGCGIYAGVALLQYTPQPLAGDPAWQRLNEILGLDLPPRVAGRSSISIFAVGQFLLFAAAFLNGLLAGTSRSHGTTLFIGLAYAILAYAAYALLAYLVAPNSLLWITKVAYRGSLTGTFVNHNTAGTFFGTGTILWTCYVIAHARTLDFVSWRLLFFRDIDEKFLLTLVLRALGVLLCLAALLQTGSRGAILCTATGLLTSVVLVMPRGRYGSAALALALLLVPIAVMAVGSTGRIGSEGLFDDGRWKVYSALLPDILNGPLLGRGAGTFQDMFPALRPPALYTWGVWEHAHSTILEIAFEMGWPIAAMMITGAIGSVVLLVRATVREPSPRNSWLAAGAGTAVLAFLHSLIDFSLQVPGYFTPFAILLGCALARASMPTSQEPGRRSGTR